MEPEVGFEPTTFRLRDGCSASTWTAPDGSSLLTLDGPSVQTAPDGSRRIVWMIIGMIKAHPRENRMPRQAIRAELRWREKWLSVFPVAQLRTRVVGQLRHGDPASAVGVAPWGPMIGSSFPARRSAMPTGNGGRPTVR